MVPLCLHAEESMPEFTPDLPLVLDLVSRSASATYDGNLWLRPASMACPRSAPNSKCLARFLLSQSF